MSQTFKSVEEITERINWLNTLLFEIQEYSSKGLLKNSWVENMTNMLSLRILHIQQGIEFCMTEEAYLSLNPKMHTGEFTAKDEDKQKARSFLDDWIKDGEAYEKGLVIKKNLSAATIIALASDEIIVAKKD